MMLFLILSTLLFLQSSADGSIKTAERYWTLKPNVLVVNVDSSEDVNMVPLTCGEAYEGKNITWTRNDENLKDQGNRVDDTVEAWKGGNYSCFNSEGSYLNHTLVLAQWTFRKFIENTPGKGYIDCTTNNYGGSFKCNWTWAGNRNGHVVHFKASRIQGGSNISCSLDDGGASITCLDHDYCPYAEEVVRINLTVYFRSSFVVEAYNTKFYIMDIVRPDMVPINRINKTSVEVRYPNSWNTPSSYFPLMFQVVRCRKREKCDCSKPNFQEILFTQSHQLPVTKGMCVCVRARDEFCNSSWSDWSQYKCKTTKNSRKRNRELKITHKTARDTNFCHMWSKATCYSPHFSKAQTSNQKGTT
ncbi:interleukin 12Ba [Puntigrus tetrazona]|uniref:interleukin 12Ba n=1 Tax=Puntigrus tetrazona TaxID=1606681 RepID=UPI001C8A4914|nr:interleukin 12Ba [Puntigrus tetrazona]